ncbi:hypothetical protein ANCDUO_25958, partial [Ancylostoma duodenale]
LDIFDLPIPIAIFVVIAWIFICSATFCIWEHDWDYFVAFYFFFISLSIPTMENGISEDVYFQAKLERTYEAGRMQQLELEAVGMLLEPNRPQRRGSSLGTVAHTDSTVCENYGSTYCRCVPIIIFRTLLE